MLGFPLPYRDELLYSTIARYGVQCGITSAKELVRDVFGDSKIIATSDLPGHLKFIEALYPKELGVTGAELLYKHTLFPVYAPFVGEERRNRLLNELLTHRKNTVYLTAGIAASRIKQPRFLRYCPGCFNNQMLMHGEYYWRRTWQVLGAESCPEHGQLVDSKLLRHDTRRHSFLAADGEICPQVGQQRGAWQSDLLAISISDLLNIGATPVPELLQWGILYRRLAVDHHFNRGNQIRHDLVRDLIVQFWGADWLARYGLLQEAGESFWLKDMFRKHRKAFSYLEHLVVLHALLEPGWSISDIVQLAARTTSVKKTASKRPMTTNRRRVNEYRSWWLSAVAKQGVKQARSNGIGHVYAWLYRHDYVWLMETNRKHKKIKLGPLLRADWYKRDRYTVKKLFVIRDQSEQQLYTPRKSRNWYLNTLGHKASIEKHLAKMPLCRMFFERYCESIFEYQIRRITRTFIRFSKAGKSPKRWQVLRCSGLSEERLTKPAYLFLKEILGV
ncbi:TnsD family Tn7-like transposition protein [Marinobacterium jannaschii]|uniref:TnsD family Tn7-like transposition protein n=1 Tax=Marinobacterium jannaschii TaxID=64970 RepID=UPI000484E6E2|nr:TnsD family Tn7-like transposition protein [Marinobacterium jannaschii]